MFVQTLHPAVGSIGMSQVRGRKTTLLECAIKKSLILPMTLSLTCSQMSILAAHTSSSGFTIAYIVDAECCVLKIARVHQIRRALQRRVTKRRPQLGLLPWA